MEINFVFPLFHLILKINELDNLMQNFHGRVNGIKVTAVDTTGAGDAFVGGLLNSMASDPDIYQVITVRLL